MKLTKTLSYQNLGHFNFVETKRNVIDYFKNLENLKWEWTKLNAQRGLVTKYKFNEERKKEGYTSIGKDIFNIATRELTEKELQKHLAGFEWATSILSDLEQLYIMEYFMHRKYDEEIVDLLGFDSRDSTEFRRLKRNAIYKFADFLNLVVEKVEKNEGE
ncbi:MAG: hypothetical protein FWC91_09470 [Defluviitaleaceae bacterium]|nr:hypothetical protein [Defluviitaleaceae bacterium]